jgi:hypothetical protein
MNNIQIPDWLKALYSKEGLPATIAVVVLIFALVVAGKYLDVNLLEWLK